MVSGRPPGRREEDHRAALQRLFLMRYDADASFGQVLMALVPIAEAARIGAPSGAPLTASRIWQTGGDDGSSRARRRSAEITLFASAADDLAKGFGLDRLGDAARKQIVAWCSRYIRARRAGTAHPSLYGPRRFSTASLPPRYEGDPVGIISPPWHEEMWPFTRERREDVRRRLEARARAHIQMTLARIETDVKSEGFVFPDTTPKLERDLDWLYQKVRHRRTFQQIHDSLIDPPHGGVDSLRKTVRTIAHRVGVNMAGWETGWR